MESLYVLVALVIAVFVYWMFFYKTFVNVESKKTLKYKLKPSFFRTDKTEHVFLFEPDDIKYYEEEPLHLYERLRFDENAVEIPNIDYQNVHDPYVNKYIRKLFNDVSKYETQLQTGEIIDGAPEDKKKTVGEILECIRERNSTLTNLNDVNEVTVINSVWQKAKSNENIKNMFYTQLIDSYENGHIVCPSGVVNRVVSSISVENPEEFPKTKEMINMEILQKASKVRNDIKEDEDFKQVLMAKLAEDYKNILSKDELQKIVSPWIDSI